MMNLKNKLIRYLFISVIALCFAFPAVKADAANTPRFSKKTYKVGKGYKVTLKLKNTKGKKVKWKIGKKAKQNIKVLRKTKNTITVKGKRVGRVVVTAKVGTKKAKATVRIKKRHIYLSQKTMTLKTGTTGKIFISGTKNATWSSSNKKVATVTKIGRTKARIRAKKAGIAYVKAKVGNKIYKCYVNVRKQTKRKNPDTKYKNMRKKIYKQLGIKRDMKTQYICFLLAKWECDYLDYGKYNSKSHGQTYQEAFDYRKVVCGGYSDLYEYMLDGLGIENVCVRVNGLHGWNAVKIDGHWYYVDVTFMDDKRAESEADKDYVPRYYMDSFLSHKPTFSDFIIDPYAVSKDKHYTVKEIKKSTNNRFSKCYVDAIKAYEYDNCKNYPDPEGMVKESFKTNYGTENPSVDDFCSHRVKGAYPFSPWVTGTWVNY